MAVDVIPPTTESRLARLEELGRKWQISAATRLPTLQPPPIPHRYATESDRTRARTLISQLRQNSPKHKESSRGLTGVFKKKPKEPDTLSFECTWKEACVAIASEIESRGSPGVVEACLEYGAQSRIARRASINVLKKMRKSDEPDVLRSQNLQRAVVMGQTDVVRVLSSRGSNQAELNAALGVALQTGFRDIVEILLTDGADGGLYPDLFDKVVNAGTVEIVELLLRAPKPIPEDRITSALQFAVASKSKKTVALLTAYSANFNHESAKALRDAVRQKDVGLTLGIFLSKPPQWDSLIGSSLDQLVAEAWDSSRAEREPMMEVLLCAGAHGENVALTLIKAVKERNVPVARLLVTHGASVNHLQADALKEAVASHDVDLVRIILQGRPQTKFLANALIHAVREKQTNLASLFVQYGASTDYKDAAAICTAVKNEDAPMIEILLTGKPSQQTLQKGFSCINKTHSTQYAITKLFVDAGTSGVDVDTAFIEALSNNNLSRNLDLITMLAGVTDVDYNDGECLRIASDQGDLNTLKYLLARSPSVPSVSSALPHAMKYDDFVTQYKMVQSLLAAGATGDNLAEALLEAIDIEAKLDSKNLDLIRLLLKSNADVNYKKGEAIEKAVRTSSGILQLIVVFGKPGVEALDRALPIAIGMKDRKERVVPIELLLKNEVSQHVLDLCLIQELETRKTGYPAVVKLLLEKNASVVYEKGKALQYTVLAGNTEVLDMFFAKKPPMEILENAFPLAIRLSGNDRFTIVRKFLEAGLRGEAIDKALAEAVKQKPVPKNLCKLLLEFDVSLDFNGGEAVRTAAEHGDLDVLRELLAKGPSEASLSSTFKSALWLKNRSQRHEVMSILMTAKMNEEDVGVGLIYLVKEEPYDVNLIKLMLERGASVNTNSGESVRFAAENGRVEILSLLLSHKASPETLSAAFPCALELRVPELRLRVTRMLLEAGLAGDGLDAALVRCLRETTRDPRLVKLLLDHKASVDYNDGEALQAAARNGEPSLLEALMAKNPMQKSVAHALPYLFLAKIDENEVLPMLNSFLERDPDVNLKHPECEPLIFMCMRSHPRSAMLIQVLLDAGCRVDQGIPYVVNEKNGAEYVTPLLWALYQRNDMISTGVICTLIKGGANPSFRASSGKTPILLAAQHSRHTVLSELLSRTPASSITLEDNTNGFTPLVYAARSGDLKTINMLLDAGAHRDDGSVHEAAKGLHADAVRLLMQNGHSPDYPSPLHIGHTALAEVCLWGRCGDYARLKDTMRALFDGGVDLSIQTDGKSMVLLALDNRENPYAMLKVLLECGGWKSVNEEYNRYTDNVSGIVYGPTTYVSTFCKGRIGNYEDVVGLLKHHRCKDVLYAPEGTQPSGFVGAPEYVVEAERIRKAEAEAVATLERRHAMALRHEREAAEQKASLEHAKHAQEQKLREDAEKRMIERQNAEHRARMLRAEEVAKKDKELAEREAERGRRRLSEAERLLSIEKQQEKEKRDTAAEVARLERASREEAEALSVREHQRQMALVQAQIELGKVQAKAGHS